MIENVMHHIGGVGMFGIISVLLFFAFFAGMVVWAASLKKPYLNSMRDLPLDQESAPNSEPNLISSHE
jgi:cytochrome c oxidase cbb3-type subunit 4